MASTRKPTQDEVSFKEFIEEAPAQQEPFEPYVEWQGLLDYREISREQWAQAGVDDQETVWWTRDNPRLPLSRLSGFAHERLAAEPDFVFVLEPPKEND